MTQITQEYCEKLAAQLKASFQTRAFIDGKFVDAQSGKAMPTFNPATEEVLAHVASCGTADVDRAVAVARQTFESGVWSRMHPSERSKILFRFADIIERELVPLAVLESLNSGKPVGDCMRADLQDTLAALRWHAGFSDKRYDRLSPSGIGAVGMIVHEPIGVVACIVPWNFPIMTTMWKMAPALAEGNSVIVKPASSTPLSILRIAELAMEAGLPEGVLQVIPGPGGVLGEALGLHPDVDCISFTGSTPVGRQLLEYSSRSNLKKIILELGGKSPMVVLDDVKDLSGAVNNALVASYSNTGQNCTANSRIIVPAARKEEFVSLMLEELEKSWFMGAPLDLRSNLGSMISKSHFESVMRYIDNGKAAGVRVATGGEARTIDGKGFFIQPTLFVDPALDSPLVTEEIFGPVACVIGAPDNETAITMANDTEYGLQASLFTDDLRKAHLYARRLRAGTVSVNKYCEGDFSTPFGGFKLSGFGGQDKAPQAHEQYCETKTIFINLED